MESGLSFEGPSSVGPKDEEFMCPDEKEDSQYGASKTY